MINRIRDIRREKNLTLAEVAARCSPPTTAQTIGRLETGMRNLSLVWMNRIGAALEVDNPERGSEIPVRLHVEVERARRPVSTHFDVIRAALASRNTLVRHIRNCQQTTIASLLDRAELDVELLDLLRSLTIGLLNFRGIGTRALRARHFICRRVLFAFQSLELGENPPATRFKCGHLFKLARQIHATFL